MPRITTETDRLIAESERLRQEMLHMATRLETFSELLDAAVVDLRSEATDKTEGGPDAPGPRAG
jgi:hypothetical protein